MGDQIRYVRMNVTEKLEGTWEETSVACSPQANFADKRRLHI